MTSNYTNNPGISKKTQNNPTYSTFFSMSLELDIIIFLFGLT